MAKIITPLSANQVKNAKPRDKLYKLSDGGGLALWVYPPCGRSWKLSFVQDGRQQTISLGRYPDFSLADAREWREEVRRKRAHGENVVNKKVRADFAFEKVARDWFVRWSKGRSEKYAGQVMRNFERWVFPAIGNLDIRQIRTADVVGCLRVMEARGIVDTLRKTKNSLKMVFAFAVGSGMMEINPVAQIGSGVFERAKTGNMAALSPSELPRLIDFLEQRNEFAVYAGRVRIHPVTRLCIYWLLLTMTRIQEAALMEWSELDGEVWRIPAERKKERRGHDVPLSRAMQWVLDQARALNVNGRFVFESVNFQGHINKESPRVAMQRAGLDTTAHGLRSLARTYLREVLKVDNDVAEKLLAHSLGTRTQTAYNRSELWEERKDALERWGNDVLRLAKNGK
ncbi:TPA: integrase arm-type DNA-binding domain-containing protein [Neisseria meningitidis]|uniref:tyrosine-type recombinase/integrase n=1 Tax=Neisseria meningitidis TaxID=487 RepID=UPI00046DFF8C|nr:integrase arm-type DNA-binding domain-containing protein [Neisseria meningitidis]MBJ7793005.1 integrase arm-type DNA-binding domain-containing protein [Neisseria meningitidis]RPC11353.1 integrase [Neisseria meningitidis]